MKTCTHRGPPVPPSTTQKEKLCIFSDASTLARGAVAYLIIADTKGQDHGGFDMGKLKVAPRPSHTTSGTLSSCVGSQMTLAVDAAKFFTTVRLCLVIHTTLQGFIHNFPTGSRIRGFTHPDQWYYVPTELNPATRSIPAAQLHHSSWFLGPAFLRRDNAEPTGEANLFTLIQPDVDDLRVLLCQPRNHQVGSQYFEQC